LKLISLQFWQDQSPGSRRLQKKPQSMMN
jgi:hypothetical protein